MSTIYLNADRTAIVPAGSDAAAFGVQPKDMKRLGYDKLPVLGGVDLPDLPEPETAEQIILVSQSVAPEPDPDAKEEKEDDKPEDKAADKPADKAVKKPKAK